MPEMTPEQKERGAQIAFDPEGSDLTPEQLARVNELGDSNDAAARGTSIGLAGGAAAGGAIGAAGGGIAAHGFAGRRGGSALSKLLAALGGAATVGTAGAIGGGLVGGGMGHLVDEHRQPGAKQRTINDYYDYADQLAMEPKMAEDITNKLANQQISPAMQDVMQRVRQVGLHKVAAAQRGYGDFNLAHAVFELGTKLAHAHLKRQKIASGLRALRSLEATGDVTLQG